METFKITEEQRKAFNSVARAIKKAQKTGLVFFSKSSDLVAYTEAASDYVDQDFEACFCTRNSQIESISRSGLIRDSGADDYPEYRTYEDELKYSGDSEEY